jgi:uncharacterized protein YgbK (DUF1537 family)
VALAERLQTLVSEGADLAILEAVANLHLRAYKNDGAWLKAVENVFGKGEDAVWIRLYRAELTNREAAARKAAKAEEEAKAQAAPQPVEPVTTP